jgi:hypothetical protein
MSDLQSFVSQELDIAQSALGSPDMPKRISVANQLSEWQASHYGELDQGERDQLDAAVSQLTGNAPGASQPNKSPIAAFFGSLSQDAETATSKVGGLFSGDNLKLIAIAAIVVGVAYTVGKFK